MLATRRKLDDALDDDFESPEDSLDSPDSLGSLDSLDSPDSPDASCRRRSRSRPRRRRVKVGKESPQTSRVSKSERSREELAVQAVRKTAEDVARQVCEKNQENLDLACEVYGVTHRGGFKLRVAHLEQMTSAMVDRWRALCLSKGYASVISFDVTASEARIVATPIMKAAIASWSQWCVKTDPLTTLFGGALALNTLRHILTHFS